MEKSPIDELFFELYGFYPNKSGQAYEMLVSAAFKLLYNKDIDYDKRIRGDFSKTVYQLDGLVTDGSKNEMVEAKDYTINKRKVGRGDLQKLQGALIDLPLTGGVFASATGFTKPASNYAEGSEINPLTKSIELFDIRPSTEEDENGRLKKIIINMSMHVPDYGNGIYKPVFTKKGWEKIEFDGIAGKSINFMLENFYDEHGTAILTLTELTRMHAPGTNWRKDHVSMACWVIDGYLKIESELYEVKGLQYEIPFSVGENQIIIEGGGNAKIYIKSHSGKVDKLITDEELKKVVFKDGKVTIKS